MWGSSKDHDLTAASSPDKSCRRSLFTRNGLIRQHSTSMIPSNRSSMLSTKGDSTESISPSGKKMAHESIENLDAANFPHVRRVSFCDSDENFIPADAPKSVEEPTDNKETCTQKCGQSSSLDATANCAAKLAGFPSDSSLEEGITKDSLDTELGRINEADKLH